MRIGFTGAHRTGKTTLARTISRVYGIPLLTSTASSVAERHQFDMATDNRLDAGVAMQAEQLDRLVVPMVEQEAASLSTLNVVSYVCDRTPIDAAAYFMADATASSGTPLSRETAVLYAERCMALTAKFFDVVILVPPAITFEPLDGKPPMNAAYQEHLHFLIRGMLFDDEVAIRVGQIERANTDRYDRVASALDFIDAHFGRERSERAAA